MWTIKYLIAVFIVTVTTIGSGTMLWLSEDQQEIEQFESWSLGELGAPVALHSFSDFT